MDLSYLRSLARFVCMLIKLRIEFYQVQCDAFVNLATNCLTFDQNSVRRFIARVCAKSLLTQSPEGLHFIAHKASTRGLISADAGPYIVVSSPVEGESTCDAFWKNQRVKVNMGKALTCR